MSWYIEPLDRSRLAEFVVLCKEFYNNSRNTEHMPFSYDRVIELGVACMQHPDWYGALCVENDYVVGGIVGRVFSMPFSDVKLGDEIGLYVGADVRFRASKAGALLQGFIEFCKSHDVVDVHMSALASMDNVAIDAFYRRNGFKPLGMMYSLRDRSVLTEHTQVEEFTHG